MEDKFINTAVEYFKGGCSCSESIVKTAISFGLAPESLFQVSTVFSGGMSSGCLCGAVAGAFYDVSADIREKAESFLDPFLTETLHKFERGFVAQLGVARERVSK